MQIVDLTSFDTMVISRFAKIFQIPSLFDSSSCIFQLSQKNWTLGSPHVATPHSHGCLPNLRSTFLHVAKAWNPWAGKSMKIRPQLDRHSSVWGRATGVAKAAKDALLLRWWKLLIGCWATMKTTFLQAVKNQQHRCGSEN